MVLQASDMALAQIASMPPSRLYECSLSAAQHEQEKQGKGGHMTTVLVACRLAYRNLKTVKGERYLTLCLEQMRRCPTHTQCKMELQHSATHSCGHSTGSRHGQTSGRPVFGPAQTMSQHGADESSLTRCESQQRVKGTSPCHP